MKRGDRISQAHLNALPVILRPIIECSGTGKPITSSEAIRILHKWDQARKESGKVRSNEKEEASSL